MATAAMRRTNTEAVTSRYPAYDYSVKSMFTRPPSNNTGGPVNPTGNNPGSNTGTNYAAVLKARLSTAPVSKLPASNQQVNSVTPAAQQRTVTTTPAASVTNPVNRPNTVNTGYADALKARLEGGTTNNSSLADMLTRTRGVNGRSGYSYGSDSGDTGYTARQSSGQGDSRTPFSYMSLDEATEQAKSKLDPTYNSLRDRMDASYSSDRDHINAQLAARYGMQGLRGGRAQSSYDQNTQEHNLAISDLENKRVAAVNEMAQALQDKDYQRAYQMYALNKQLEYQQQQLEMQQEQLDFQQDSWQQEFDYGKTKDALENDWKQKYYDRDIFESDRDYNRNIYEDDRNYDRDVLVSDRDYDWKTNPDNWYNQLYQESTGLDNAYKQAQISKMLSGGGSGGGGGSSGSGSGGSSGSSSSVSGGFDAKTSKSAADAIIADMQNEKLYLINNGGDPALYSQYMALSINDAQEEGIWDLLTDADKNRVFALINQASNY